MQTDPVTTHLRRDFVELKHDSTIEQALEKARAFKAKRPILYLYVTDDDGHLVGILPTRALLSPDIHARVDSLAISRVVTLPEAATMADASELFILHRFLAIPVVDADQRMLGVVDVHAFSDEVLDFAERRNQDTIFESIGLRMTEAAQASPWRAFRLRFPWLTATLAGGTASAVIAGLYGATLAESIVLAFFLTLVLGLGESVAAQSLTFAIQALRGKQPTMAWFLKAAGRESLTAVMLGTACGVLAGGIVMVWQRDLTAALVVGISINVSLICAALLGLLVPTMLHALKLDPKVAAGPLTLALADLATLGIYLNLGMVMLGAN